MLDAVFGDRLYIAVICRSCLVLMVFAAVHRIYEDNMQTNQQKVLVKYFVQMNLYCKGEYVCVE